MDGPVYATENDLYPYLDDDLAPDGVFKLLWRASRHIDSLLLTATYDVDYAGNPTDPGVATALRNATAAQASWWVETGDPSGAGSQWQQMSAGSVALTRGYGAQRSAAGDSRTRTSFEAVDILATAGLLSHAVRSGS